MAIELFHKRREMEKSKKAGNLVDGTISFQTEDINIMDNLIERRELENSEKARNLVHGAIPLRIEDINTIERRELERSEKARNLVDGAIPLQTEDINIIAQDDIIRLAKRFLDAQMDFSERNIPIHVDIAYHHTRGENLKTIQSNGLLSHSERKIQNIVSKHNGSVYGDGIYCSSDPMRHAFKHYGDTTILLARMKGVEEYNRFRFPNKDYKGYNTLNVSRAEFCVLQNGNQCIPLFRFPSHLLRTRYAWYHLNFLENLFELQEKVQLLLDKIFNDNVPTKVDNAWISKPRQKFDPFPLKTGAVPAKIDTWILQQLNKLERPRSAYNIFFTHIRSRIAEGLPAEGSTEEIIASIEGIVANSTRTRTCRKTHGQISFGDLARTIADKWKNIDKQHRALFDHYAALDMKRYRQGISIWRAKKESEANGNNRRPPHFKIGACAGSQCHTLFGRQFHPIDNLIFKR
jgi:hypothetical protein